MKNTCYIDNIDIYSHFGVWIQKGGYNDLLTFPCFKDLLINDWDDEDGIEVDLENPVLAPKEVSIVFFHTYRGVDIQDFIAFLSIPGYHTLYIPSLQHSWKLRLLNQTLNQKLRNSTAFTLRFSEDMPVKEMGGEISLGLALKNSSYGLDNHYLSEFGIIVQSGADSILKSPTVKESLCRNLQTQDGQIYDVDTLVFNSKDVTLKCFFKVATINHFWKCYNAFLNILTLPGERSLYVDYTGEEYPCFYKKASGFKVIKLKDPVLVEFNLTLTFTVFRITETDYILASEANEWITLEDGETVIDLKYYD